VKAKLETIWIDFSASFFFKLCWCMLCIWNYGQGTMDDHRMGM